MSHPHETDPPPAQDSRFDTACEIGQVLVLGALVVIALGAGCGLTTLLFRTGWRIFQ